MRALNIWVSGFCFATALSRFVMKDYVWGTFNVVLGVINLYIGIVD